VRIKQIDLAWFRGAADSVPLNLDGKSTVVYGENGSGKSSFVDALEFALKDGKIGHLSHEYSGKNQERGILNTHAPKDKATQFAIAFMNDEALVVDIKKSGAHTSKGAEKVGITTWDYRTVALRQDEVAAFIGSTKGNKYSALLPLFGLGSLEFAAENIRQLAKAAETVAEVKVARFAVQDGITKVKAILGDAPDGPATIATLHKKHCATGDHAAPLQAKCAEIRKTLTARVAALTAEQKKHYALISIAEVDLGGTADQIRASALKLAGRADTLIEQKLAVLREAVAFANEAQKLDDIACPACGRAIGAVDFLAHVTAEQSRLEDALVEFEQYKSDLAAFADHVKTIKSSIAKKELAGWSADQQADVFASTVEFVSSLDPASLRDACTPEQLKKIENALIPVIVAAQNDVTKAPPEASELASDQRMVDAVEVMVETVSKKESLNRAETLLKFLETLENSIRAEIRIQSEKTMAEISGDIQRMWLILHPDEHIADVRLHQPEGTDKAIDIDLRFHGVELDSPRLTLSEGNRNSLGLCIFLAMAKRDAKSDRPVFLDDVIVSLDRNHRGMVAELLEKEFADRQIVVLTHDREWFIELRTLLDAKRWAFKALLPYGEPTDGIRWSFKTSTFADARSQVTTSPDTAGNTARKIMDSEMSMAAAQLKLKLDYRQGFKNDHRMAHEFLERLTADGDKAFEIKDGETYRKYSEATAAFTAADKLLMTWGNRASHSFDVVKPEAEKLIDACERAQNSLDCDECKRPVYQLDDSKGIKQCSCGKLRWRYGKL
jgi:energy-coupling factor transporter ATP-binding protein EcfA2